MLLASLDVFGKSNPTVLEDSVGSESTLAGSSSLELNSQGATAPKSGLIEAAQEVETEPFSEAKRQFLADIQLYNQTQNAEILLRLRDYIGQQSDDAERFDRIGRELIVDDTTIDLLFAVAETVFMSNEVVSTNTLGFIVLRLDASDFWQAASIDQQVQFEALVAAIRSLPPEGVHRFTRFMADRAHERMEVKEEALPESTQLLHHLTRRQRFEILGTDYNAVQTVGMMARALESIVGDYLPYIDDFPQPIWIRIESGTSREPTFQIQVTENGNVGITIFWNEQISIEDVSDALSWGLLQRIAIWRWNARDQSAVPYWLWRALAAEIPVALQTARNQGLARDVSEIKTLLPLPELLRARAFESIGMQENPEGALQALWFYRFLRDQAPSRQMFGMLAEAFLAGEDSMTVLRQAFPDQTASDEMIQEWWEIGLTSLVHRQHGVIYSLDQSSALIDSLSGVTAWWQGQDRRMSGPALLPLREDPRWQSAFWRQQRELKLELRRINPIYFNTLLSLGHFYELLLARGGSAEQMSAADLRREAEAAYARFLEDWSHARALHRAVDEVLQMPSN